jgi:hypothetical protein
VADLLTAGNELTYASFPIERVEQTADGHVMVWGKATDDSVDSDNQIIDADFASKAIDEWMSTGPNVRVQHQAQRDPAGVGISVERDGTAHWVKSKIIEPVAKQLVLGGALRAYSVGIARPTIQRDSVARGGRITDGQIVEISLVDRPANKNCGIALVKADKDGNAEWIGKAFGTDGMLAKMGGQDVTVTLPHDVQVSFSPLDLAKIVARKHVGDGGLLTKDVTSVHGGGVPAGSMPKDGVHPDDCKCGCMKEDGDAEVAKAKLSAGARNDLPDSAFAIPGERAYPIHDKSHARNALARVSQHGTPEEKAKVRAAVDRRYPGMGARDEKKAAKKAAAVAQQALPEATKKDKAACVKCGAMQNSEHEHCSECGSHMGGAIPVEKNHDFMCLKCGTDLDKGEKFCTKCGTANPGYNPMADLKIPMNADKAEGSRVADLPAETTETAPEPVEKAKKPKKKKGNPFGDKQAPPFGKDKDADDKPDARKSGKNKTADAPVTAVKGKKGGFGHDASPGDGVTGEHTESVPAHREPDGLAVAALEHDAGLPTDSRGDGNRIPALKGKKKLSGPVTTPPAGRAGMSAAPGRRGKAKKVKGPMTGTTADHGMPDEHIHPVPSSHRDGAENQEFDRNAGKSADPAVAASMRLKGLGIDQDMGYTHDLVCPAFSWDQVSKAYPAGWESFSADQWQQKALEAAASAPLPQAQAAAQLGQAAFTIKSSALNDLVDVKSDMYKAFRDANPGPGSFPTPGDIHPQSFQRPNITTGHAAYSRQYGSPNSASVPESHPAASMFDRGFIQPGRAEDSPANKSGAPYPSTPGVHMNLDYSSIQKEQIAQAFRAMHDHFDRVFPGVCPMNGSITSPPAHSLVPAQKADDGVVTKKVSPDGMSKKARKKLTKKLTRKVMNGKMPLDQARVRMGKKPKTSPEPLKPQKGLAAPVLTKARLVKGEAVLTPRALAAVLRKAQKESDKKIAALTKAVNVLADQPDPATQAFKGMAVNPMRTKSASPAGVQSTAEVAERTQLMIMRELESTARNSTNSMEREAAWNQVLKLKGITP